jgi:hypothetical protein
MKHYAAPWSGLLVIITLPMTALCLGLAIHSTLRGGWGLSLFLVALTVGCACTSIRGYSITPDAILIHRPFWTTHLPLAGLQSAQVAQPGMLAGIRIGNGGFFSFTGWRYGTRLGLYRVFLTDHHQAVILRYPLRTIAISPSPPGEFVRDLPIPYATKVQ